MSVIKIVQWESLMTAVSALLPAAAPFPGPPASGTPSSRGGVWTAVVAQESAACHIVAKVKIALLVVHRGGKRRRSEIRM